MHGPAACVEAGRGPGRAGGGAAGGVMRVHDGAGV